MYSAWKPKVDKRESMSDRLGLRRSKILIGPLAAFEERAPVNIYRIALCEPSFPQRLPLMID